MRGSRVFIEPLAAARIQTPVGPLDAEVDADGRLVRLDFEGRRLASAGPLPALDPGRLGAPAAAALASLAAELAEYFEGRRRAFTASLAPRGTPFQGRVWDELRRIPYGETLSYRELAARVGSPAAVRAVGRANAKNPIAIVVPCHRVIGADGSLTGYGGGIDRKQRLLELEGALPSSRASPARG
jgi:methylated-DNA-[protein]-cysteine S-methyltransferase